MAKTIRFIVNTGKAQTTQTFDVTQGSVQGQPMRIQAVNGARYQLQDPAANNTAPQNLRTKRLGKNLHISLEGSTESDLIIEGYYDAPPEMGGQGSVYGRAEDGKLYEYSSQAAGAAPAPMALQDGAPALSQTLGGVEMEEGYELSNLSVSGDGFGGFVTSLVGVAVVTNNREKIDNKVTVAVNKIEAYNNGDGTTPAALTLQDYVDAGVSGVTAHNLAVVNAKVLAASTGGADTTAEVQALVTAAVGAYDASLNLIATYAETGVTAPALGDYTHVGVVGVTMGNLAAINSAINAQAGADNVVGNANDREGADTAVAVQSIVSAYNAILSAADGVDNTANSANPTQTQYASIGVKGVSTDAHASLLGDIIDRLASSAVDTVAKVQALADAVAAVLTGAANGTAPTLVQLSSLGLANVNTNNIALVQATLAGTANDGSDVDTWAELQALIRSVNTPAIIGGDTTKVLTEANAALSTGGTLTITDADGSPTFTAQTNIAGSNGYGAFSIDAAGVWTYTMNGAHDAFVGGTAYTDSLTGAAVDGTQQVVTVTITGTNDAVVISGTSTAAVTETNTAQSASGTLVPTDVDGTDNAFTAQTNIAGSNGYGIFSIDTAGAWTYTMNSAHDVFVGGQNYTDSLTVAAIDGTQQVLTITITGTNDAAIISGTSTATLTETNAAQTATGTLTSADVDGTANLFTAQTSVTGSNGYGTFSIDAAGVWTYTMNSAHDVFVGGQSYTDSLTVATADGTQQEVTVTIVGSNDAAVINGASTAALTETNAAQTATGTLTSADADGTANLFTAQTSVAGSHGYGAFSITSGGVWTYTMNSAHDAFVGGQSYTDSLTVATADGTQQEVTVTITGSNDAPTTALITYTCMEETPAPINGTTTGTALADLPALAGKDAEGTVVGLAIVSPTSNSYATLWFSLNGGTTWTSLSTVAGLSFTNALVLDRTARIYFQPGSDKSGANLASITQYAWDGTDGAVSGSRVDLTGKTGVSGAYSAASNFLKVSVTDINDVPSLTATATGGPYTGAAVTAFSSANVYAGGSMGESSQKFIKLVLTVSGLADGASEQLTVDGSTFSLTDGSTGATSTNGVTYTVSLTGTTATVTLDKAAGVASAAFNTLVNSIAYSDVASVRTSGNRVTRLTTLQDSGGVTSGGIDTATLNLASTVNVQATVPVVFDLNRDGTFSYSQVVMDVNGDGLLDKTAWAGAQDGVLVWDKYADAQVHDASQYAFAQYGGRTDLQGLAAGFDTNLDGKFNAQDTKFAQFKIWQDLNQNGISDAGEVRSLADWGIAEINLSSDGVVRTPAAGVAEAGRATATTTDGSILLVADASFDSAPLDYSITVANTPQTGATLSVLGSGMSIDLSRFIAQHGAIAEVDLSGTGANTLTLSLNDVLQGASANILKVTGDADDVLSVQLATDWANTGSVVASNDHSYVVFSANANSAAQLLIDQHLLIHAS